MIWRLFKRCWCILNDEFEQLWDYLSNDNGLILCPIPARAVRRQLSRCAREKDPAKSPLDPNRFLLD